MISKLFSREPDTRVYFATDIHGSETCWRKFLNSGKHYEANIMVLGGDMTGKALVPIVEEGNGPLARDAAREPAGFESEDEVKEFEDSVMRRGYYPFRTDPDEMSELDRIRGSQRRALPQGDAGDRRALDADGRREARRHRHRVLRLPRQRRPVRGR